MLAFFPAHLAAEIIIVALATAAVFWLILARSVDAGHEAAAKRSVKVTLGVALAAWFAVILVISQTGAFHLAQRTLGVPNLFYAIGLPIALGALLLFEPRSRTVLDRIPQGWLAGFHGLRIVFGFIFLAIYELGELPAGFALSAGYGDVLAGVLGLVAAYLVVAKHALSRWSLIVFNTVGLFDFLSVVPTGVALIPDNAPFQNFYPFYLIPGFVVPMFFAFHIYSIRGLMICGCEQRRAVEPQPALA